MYKSLLKVVSIFLLSNICFSYGELHAHRSFDVKSKPKDEIKNSEIKPKKENKLTLDDKFESNFDNYQSFEDSINPTNQIKNFIGIEGFPETKLKESAFSVWETYKKEMSNQIGNRKVKGSDINNTFNDSLKTLNE